MSGASPLAVVAVAACGAAIALAVYLALGPRPVRVPIERRRPGAAPRRSLLSAATDAVTGLIAKALRRRGSTRSSAAALEAAGVRLSMQDFTLLVIAAALVVGALGLVVGGPLLGLLLAAIVPVLAKVGLGFLLRRRQRAFADQLDDSLQLMASSLRAGHSLLQALASVAREAEQPTSQEYARIINENRVGRELSETLEEVAERMGSQDFVWVTQAIAINREVGGNLADVLDGVGHTIRERNQLRRQVGALAAEGKLSAFVLMALPFGIIAFLSITNPDYVGAFTSSIIGYAMIVASVIMLVAGGIWLSKVVRIKF